MKTTKSESKATRQDGNVTLIVNAAEAKLLKDILGRLSVKTVTDILIGEGVSEKQRAYQKGALLEVSSATVVATYQLLKQL